MNKKMIEILLNELNDELKKEYMILDITIVGGALLTLYSFKDCTEDIDVIKNTEINEYKLDKIIKNISYKYKINDKWLNDSVSNVINKNIIKYSVYNNLSNLKINKISLETLLAMKIYAGRNKDIEDCKKILKEIKINEFNEIKLIIKRIFGNEIDLINKIENNRIDRFIRKLLISNLDWS